MSLEIVVIIDTRHPPYDQLLIQDIINQIRERKRREYLSPRIEVLRDLSCRDPPFEAFVLLYLRDFSCGRFSAQIPTEEHSSTGLFSRIGSKCVVDPVIFHLSTSTHWGQMVRGFKLGTIPGTSEPTTHLLSQGRPAQIDKLQNSSNRRVCDAS